MYGTLSYAPANPYPIEAEQDTFHFARRRLPRSPARRHDRARRVRGFCPATRSTSASQRSTSRCSCSGATASSPGTPTTRRRSSTVRQRARGPIQLNAVASTRSPSTCARAASCSSSARARRRRSRTASCRSAPFIPLPTTRANAAPVRAAPGMLPATTSCTCARSSTWPATPNDVAHATRADARRDPVPARSSAARDATDRSHDPRIEIARAPSARRRRWNDLPWLTLADTAERTRTSTHARSTTPGSSARRTQITEAGAPNCIPVMDTLYLLQARFYIGTGCGFAQRRVAQRAALLRRRRAWKRAGVVRLPALLVPARPGARGGARRDARARRRAHGRGGRAGPGTPSGMGSGR